MIVTGSLEPGKMIWQRTGRCGTDTKDKKKRSQIIAIMNSKPTDSPENDPPRRGKKGKYQLPPKEQKPAHLAEQFSRIAPGYDRFNQWSTLGMHRRWKRALVRDLLATLPVGVTPSRGKFLDLLCGTGDISFLLAGAGGGHVRGLDISSGMLEVAARRREAEDPRGRTEFVKENIEVLRDWPADTFDGVTMGFGLRNVPDIDQTLADIYRVLKPGGWFFHIDLGRIGLAPLRWGSEFYFHHLVPVLGKLLDPRAGEFYAYLPESGKAHPAQAELAAKFTAAGFRDVNWKNYLFGQVVRHRGRKPGENV